MIKGREFLPPRENLSESNPLPLRMVAWEVTRSCNLNCRHCRAAAERGPYPGELSTEESLKLIDEIVSFSTPVVILTGGEPLLREDIYEIASYGTSRGLRMVIAPNGTLLDGPKAEGLQACGIKRVSISLDGATPESHDSFRQVEGAFAGALKGIEYLKGAGLEFQINTTVTQKNYQELPAILDLALRLGAVAHHIFLLVPTGRGKDLAEETIQAEEYEKILHWFYEQREKFPLQLKATCAPHYYRILRQRSREEGKSFTPQSHGLDAITRGCLGGIGFCFISHRGDIQPCGYLEVMSGNLRKQTLREIWELSPVFQRLRDFSSYKGRCGRCEYIRVCGGCRARAFEKEGDYMAEEPLCVYNPRKTPPLKLPEGLQ
ncbi:MAG: heme b synthase [Deltaproteobacteria bacterium]|nr:heme b synthase [Deltaproteobacteria bacterium]